MDTNTTAPIPPGDPRRRLGDHGERLAEDHLVESGLQIVARNWRIAAGELRGEIDLVARDGDALVVVEVKTRRGRGYGLPAESVTPRKQAKLRRLATAFLRDTGLRAASVRFDVVGVLVEGERTTVTHLRGAF